MPVPSQYLAHRRALPALLVGIQTTPLPLHAMAYARLGLGQPLGPLLATIVTPVLFRDLVLPRVLSALLDNILTILVRPPAILVMLAKLQ